MNRLIATIAGLVVAAVIFRASAFIVDQRQFAIVFALGEVKEVITEPGLHFKLPPPFQNVVYIEKRILTIDTPQADRVQTSEKKNLLVDSFVKWRISDSRRYWVSFLGNERAAEERINSLVRDAMNQAINKRTVNDVTSRERDKAMDEIRVAVQERVKDVGVEIVDVRLKRVEFVAEINEDVFRRMQSERKRVATEQRSIGSAEGEKIRADADRQREVLLAEAYRASFRNRSDVVVVDPSSEFFKYLKTPGAVRANR